MRAQASLRSSGTQGCWDTPSHWYHDTPRSLHRHDAISAPPAGWEPYDVRGWVAARMRAQDTFRGSSAQGCSGMPSGWYHDAPRSLQCRNATSAPPAGWRAAH